MLGVCVLLNFILIYFGMDIGGTAKSASTHQSKPVPGGLLSPLPDPPEPEPEPQPQPQPQPEPEPEPERQPEPEPEPQQPEKVEEPRWWDKYNRWDPAHENIVECIQTTTYKAERVNLAALIPFIPAEAAATEDLLQSMATARGQPCDTDAKRNYDSALVFYMARPYHLDPTGVRSALEAVVSALPKKVRKCFDQILYIDAMLTKEQDAYGDAGRGTGMLGPNTMFYNLFTHWQLENFTHAAIIEADAVLIKSGWLDAIRATATDGVWQDGSLVGATAFDRTPDEEGQINHEARLKKSGREFDMGYRGDAKQFAEYRLGEYERLRKQRPGMYDEQDIWLPMNYGNPYVGPGSINGNALYAIANPCFKLYVERIALHPFHEAYDHNLFAYRANPFHGALTHTVYGKFRTTGVFLDVAHRRWNRQTVMEQYPNAYIVTQAYQKADNWERDGNNWKMDFWKNYERWDQSQAGVAQCVSKQFPKKVRLVVVLPFAPSEGDDVVKFVKNMAKGHAPVADKGKRRYDSALAFYISSRFANHEDLKAKLQGAVDALPTHVLRSFDDVLFRDAAVLDADAKHELQRQAIMFKNVLTDWKLKEYTHAAFLEPNATFVRSGWLDALSKTAVPGVWMDGSITNPKALTAALDPSDAEEEARVAEKGQKFEALKDLPDAGAFALQRKKTYAALRAEYATDTHQCQWDAPAGKYSPLTGPGPINGNALYSLYDTCFRQFVTRAFLHPFSMGFANDLFAYRGNPFHPDVTLAVYGKFRTSGVFVDAAHRPWDADAVRAAYPDAHIVVRGNRLSDTRAITHNGEFCPRRRVPGANCADSLPKVVIAGPLRSVADLAPHTLAQLAELNCKHGFSIHLLVGSMDDAERLCQVTTPNCGPVIIRQEAATPTNRILRIARLRAAQREMIMKLWDRAGAPLPTVVLMDCDVGEVPASTEIVEALRRSKDGGPDVACALGVWHHEYPDSYYDTFAAVHIDGTFVHRRADQMRGGDPTPPGWARAHRVTQSPIGHYTMWDLTQEVLQEAPKHGGYYPMQSCFSGLAIYKPRAFFDGECGWEYAREEFERKLSHYANNYDKEPCEHVVFNTCLHARGSRIGIDAKLRTVWHVGGQPRLKDRLEMPNPYYSGHLNDDFPITSTNTIASFVPHGFNTTWRRVEAVSTLENERFELRVNKQGVLVLEEKATKEVKWSPKIDKKIPQSNWYRTVLALGDHGELLLFQQVEEVAGRKAECLSFPESEFDEGKTCRQVLWRTNGVAQKEGVRFSLVLEKEGVLNLVRKSATETETYWSTDGAAAKYRHMTQCVEGSGALFFLPQSCTKKK